MEQIPQNPRAQEILASLEDLSLVTNQDRADLLLVGEGLKDAAEIEFDIPEGHQESQVELSKAIAAMESLLKKLNIPHNLEQGNYMQEGATINSATFSVGKTEEKVEELLKANDEQNPELKHRKRGEVLGIPPTAIDGFIQKTTIENEELPEDIKKEDAFHFLSWRLSRDHWKEEFEVVRKRAEDIKRLSPELYERIIKGKDMEYMLPNEILGEVLQDQRDAIENLRDLHESLREAEEGLQLSLTEKEEDERLQREFEEFEREMGMTPKEPVPTNEALSSTGKHILWIRNHIEQIKRHIESNTRLKTQFDEQIERFLKLNKDTLDILARSKTGKPN